MEPIPTAERRNTPTTAEINQANRKFWIERQSRQDYLVQRKYVRDFLGVGLSNIRSASAHRVQAMIQGKIPFDELIFEFAKERAEAGDFDAQRERARQPRMVATDEGKTIVQLIAEFASTSENRCKKSKELWKPFLDLLTRHKLDAKAIENPDNPEHGACTYLLKGRSRSLTYRRFQNIISTHSARKKSH